jgi:hypothetical protein
MDISFCSFWAMNMNRLRFIVNSRNLIHEGRKKGRLLKVIAYLK